MHGKALLFDDEDRAEKVMKAKSAREMKSLGRKVRYFNDNAWKDNRWDIVYRNNMAKFAQNPHLLEALLNSSGLLVEASPYDSIWGIGLDEKHARKVDPKEWPGSNFLGKILTQVREDILEKSREEDSEKDEIQKKTGESFE